jgi:hypothetical protein
MVIGKRKQDLQDLHAGLLFTNDFFLFSPADSTYLRRTFFNFLIPFFGFLFPNDHFYSDFFPMTFSYSLFETPASSKLAISFKKATASSITG